MATEAFQRAYRAACPGCGAPVLFLSAASTHAVCGYCQSTIVRNGDALQRIGKMAELFDDYSTLQLQVTGKYQGRGFTLVGRLQYKYDGGSWNEWLAVLDDGAAASLSEDNGAFVFTFPVQNQRELPSPEQWVAGSTTAINGRQFSVASVATVSLMAAQGELPKLPPLGQPFSVVDLRSEQGEVLSVDYGSTPPGLSSGKAVNLDDLQLVGLRVSGVDGSAAPDKSYSAQQFSCPQCGSPVQLNLASSKAVTCAACHSLIDVSQGIGGALLHAVQDEPVKPLIALGSMGMLQGKQWQVVGFQHRMGTEPDDPDEMFGWVEYLLYNAKAGFLFLVDATDGWSLVKPATGAPKLTQNYGVGGMASYLGTTYRLQSSYNATTTYVAGEFYWQVQRGQKTYNQDFVSGKSMLSREQIGQEITWSVGNQLDYTTVAMAFRLRDKEAAFKRADVTPLGAATELRDIGVLGWILILLLVVIFLFAVTRCAPRCDPQYENCSSGYRSGGGSYGGYSSGGGHK